MKKLRIYFVVIILAVFFPSSLFAQESGKSRIREIYLNGNLLTFNNFGLQYKSETPKGNFFRIGVTTFNSDVVKYKPGSSVLFGTISTNISGGFEIGLEKRKQLTEKLSAFYGINFTSTANFARSKNDNPAIPADLRYTDSFNINPGLGFNSGFILKITADFLMSAEIIPQILFRYSSSEGVEGSNKVKHVNTGGSLNFDNQSVRVSVIYRWNKN
jgi:hypothetical protein